jgi:hypothetical protein
MKYRVLLNIPTSLWAIVEIDAVSPKDAGHIALASAQNGEVDFENSGFDFSDTEIVDVCKS